MPIPPLLSLNAFGSLPLQVHELVGGTAPSQIGSNLSGGGLQVFVPGVATKGNMQAHAVTFKGERYCLALSTTLEVRRENQGGSGNWGVVYTFTVAGTFNSPETLGLKIIKDGGDIALVTGFVRGSGPNQIVFAKSNTGQVGSWTETSVDPGHTPRITSTTVVFRNRLYVADMISTAANLPSRVYEVDPVASAVTVISAPWQGSGSPNFGTVDMCVAFDKLWAAAPDVNTGVANSRLALYEFTGGGWAFNSNIHAFAGQASNFGQPSAGKWALFTDNNKLYCVGYTRRNDAATDSVEGSSVWEGTLSGGTFSWVQNDTTMISSLRPGTPPAGDTRFDRWSVYADNDTDPANPVFYLVSVPGSAGTIGTGHAVYQWNGFGVEMGPAPGASVSTDFAIPEVKHGGAEAISQGSATYAEIEQEEAISGGYRLSYRVYGAGSGLTGRVYYSLEQGPPDTLATLVGGLTTFSPAAGDGGATLRTVDIDLGLSGITPPDVSTWMIDLRP